MRIKTCTGWYFNGQHPQIAFIADGDNDSCPLCRARYRINNLEAELLSARADLILGQAPRFLLPEKINVTR